MSKIKECPNKPNCVSSLTEKKEAKIEALPFFTDTKTTKEKIIAAMEKLPRTELIKNEDNYLHFTCKTKLLRFVDDVEFEIDENNKLTHIKSASRLGYKDFDINRKRVEQIRGFLK